MAVKKQAGFSLLEAVVALALVVSVGVTLFGWVTQTLTSVSRIKALQEKMQAQRNTLEWVWALNPTARPQGRVEFSGMSIEWVSSPVRPLDEQIGYPTGIGDFVVGLYNVRLRVFKPGQTEPWFDENHQVIGYKKVRATSMNPFQSGKQR